MCLLHIGAYTLRKTQTEGANRSAHVTRKHSINETTGANFEAAQIESALAEIAIATVYHNITQYDTPIVNGTTIIEPPADMQWENRSEPVVWLTISPQI